MKRTAVILVVLMLVTGLYGKKEIQPASGQDANPFFAEWTAPFQAPPFDKIKDEHYRPAFQAGMSRQKEEVEAIVSNPQPPTFANTVEALERSGGLLTRVSNIFFSMTAANTNEEMQKIEAEVSPLLAKHNDDIFLNPKLFARIKAVYEQKDKLDLTPEQRRLLDKFYRSFVRGGANLEQTQQAQFRKINEELAVLTVKFSENLLKEDNAFALILDRPEDLAGLPPSVVDGAAAAAKRQGLEGKWVFTLHKPSCIPFFQYSARRDLREKLFKAFINRGNNNNQLDNKAVLSRIAALRFQRAQLLGYRTHADFVLEENMAKNPAAVFKLLDQVWKPSLEMAKKEARELQALIDQEGGKFKLEPWDWWYYAEKLKKARYELDDEILRPYFKLENVRNGAFEVAHKLWGLQFVERTDIPIYHPEVKVFELKEADGRPIGLLYTDYFPRPSKQSGAWSGAFRIQSARQGHFVKPLVGNNGNFSLPAGGRPSLLTFEEVTTLFHEFGHALHDLLSNCTYEALAGTNVPRDFVELPSQIMENWAAEPEVIKSYARHYQTGEPIPQALVDRIKKAGLFNQGFATVEYLAACYLDMDWHTLTDATERAALDFENASLARIGLIPQIVVRYRSPYFQHIFGGAFGYSAGYYSYIWSEVLDADAFEAFKEKGLFDQATAASFRQNILSRGDTEDLMTLYVKFRGREPRVEPLLKRRGLDSKE
jgi:peptidyl-dipeptidase Dcp